MTIRICPTGDRPPRWMIQEHPLPRDRRTSGLPEPGARRRRAGRSCTEISSYGLLQELPGRLSFPSLQVLITFLLTSPFAAGFPHLDSTNRFLFGVATVSGLLSVITLLTPTVFHRVANRRYRSARLVWAVRCTMVGLALLGIALDRRALLRDPPHLLDAARRRRERLRAAHDHLAVGHPPEDREAEPRPRT